METEKDLIMMFHKVYAMLGYLHLCPLLRLDILVFTEEKIEFTTCF